MPKYFFYNGNLCRKIRVNRPADLIHCWNYPEHKFEQYVYSDVLRNGDKAWTTAEVQKMVNRKRWAIANAMNEGHIKRPQHTYGLETGEFFSYKWTEDEILDLHAYFASLHHGRPRKDGFNTPKALPTRAELRAMLRNGTVTYVRDGDGKFIPTWQSDIR